MSDAASLNISSSPLTAPTGAGSAGVAAQADISLQDGNPSDFQAMLAAQVSETVSPAPALSSTLLTLAPNAPTSSLAPVQEAPAKAAPAPIMATPVMATPVMVALGLNGNLPVGGKILPVEPAPDDGAAVIAEAPPAPIADTAKPVIAKATYPSMRARKSAGAEAGQEPPATKSPLLGEVSDDAAASEDKGSGDVGTAVTGAASGSDMTAPDPITPAPIPQDNSLPGIALSMNLAAPPPQPTPAPAPSSRTEAMAAQPPAQTLATTAHTPASNQVAAAVASAIASPGAPKTSEPAPAATPAPSAQTIQAPANAQRAGNAPTVTVPVTPDMIAPQLAIAELAPTDRIIPELAVSGIARPSAKAAGQVRPDASPSSPEATTQPGASPPETAAAFLHDPVSPTLGNLSGTSAHPAASITVASGVDMTADAGASRDMGALVDRLVEARAAMRSGASTQWVQTSVQHAEFGRVALHIRQDGGNLSVAMTSNDPGFAPAAEAALRNATADAALRVSSAQVALHASQSLMQPAAAAQTNADASPDNRQQSSQPSSQQGQFGNPSSGGQAHGQTNGQDRQAPWRQQMPFLAENQPSAQQGQTIAETLSGRAPSGRSGILA